MARAKKCDICGGLYESYNFKGKEPNAMDLVQEYKNTSGNTYTYCLAQRYDCCPACMRSILDHIDSLKPKKAEEV